MSAFTLRSKFNCINCTKTNLQQVYHLSCNRHSLCCICFGNESMGRGSNPFILCQGCNNNCDSVTFLEKSEGTYDTNGNKLPPVSESKPMKIPFPSKDREPILTFTLQRDDSIKKHIRLAMAYYTENEKDIWCSSIDLPLKLPSVMLDETQKESLEIFFLKLHTVIFNHDMHDQKERFVGDSLTPIEFKNFADNDSSLLHRCLSSLCCGEKLEKMRNDHELWMKRGRGVYIASDIIRSITYQKPCLLQEAMNQLAVIHGFPEAAHKFLTSLGICGSRNYTRLKNLRDVNEKILQGWRFIEKKWCVVVVVYDNIGFKVRGKRAGYDQYTGIQVITISKERLKKAGFYKPLDCGELPISRKRKEWKNEWRNITPKQLLANDQDYHVLSKRICVVIEEILKHCDELPTHSEVITMLELRDKNEINWSSKIKTEFGSRDKNNLQFVSNFVESDEVCIDESIIGEATKEGVNDTEYEIPMKADLNASSTVRALADYSKDLLRCIQDESKKEANDGVQDDFEEYINEKPLIDDVGVFMAGDGSPSYLFHRLKDKHPESYKMVQNFCGGFHLLLELLKMRGKVFEGSHLADMIHAFRRGDKSKKWVLEPGDPSQALEEMYEATSALLVKACRETAKIANGPVSAIDVYDHMVKCASEDPTEFVIFMEMQFVEVIMMLCDSENTGDGGCDPDLFRTAMRLSLFLLATTNCFKYVQIVSEYLIWWHCASDADRLIWDKFIFTHETKKGKHIFMDRFMEWLVKDIRDVLGKFQSSKSRMHDRLTSCLINLKKTKHIKSELSSRTHCKHTGDTKPTTDSVDLSYVFCHTYSFAHSIKLWEYGSTRQISSENKTRDANEFLDTTGKNKLNEKLISLIPIAEKRLEAYLQKFYFTENLNELYRPPSEVNLQRVPTLHQDYLEYKKRDDIWKSSIKACDLKQFGKEALRSNIVYLNQKLSEWDLTPENLLCKDYKNMTIHSELLAKVRNQVKEARPDFIFKQPNEWEDSEIEPENNSLIGKIKVALNHKFFTLTNEIRDEYKENKVLLRESGTHVNEDTESQTTQLSVLTFELTP